uniref:B30.2/SPRY domain-containing protein n=1 Tax=Globodera rostochiensis TaxID=31243 RepID=A0A914HQL8_GLORO
MKAEKSYKAHLRIFNKSTEQGTEVQTSFREKIVLRQDLAQIRWREKDGFSFTGTNKLIVRHSGSIAYSRTLFAAWTIPKRGFSYFEVRIQQCTGNMYVGFAPESMVGKHCRNYPGSYAYESTGSLWGHGAAGTSTKPFGPKDVVGCGITEKRQLIYTLNGQRLNTANLFIDSADDLSKLSPCVTLYAVNDQIEGNFGPPDTFACGRILNWS